jgi:hypothetical protein
MLPRRTGAGAASSPSRVFDNRVPVFQPSPLLGEGRLGEGRPTADTVRALIAEFTNTLRPKIRDFLTNPRFHTWLPVAVDEETQQYYSNLDIPLVNGEPSLLLHNLGLFPNPHANKFFQGSKHQ